jgi:hypothetical protein
MLKNNQEQSTSGHVTCRHCGAVLFRKKDSPLRGNLELSAKVSRSARNLKNFADDWNNLETLLEKNIGMGSGWKRKSRGLANTSIMQTRHGAAKLRTWPSSLYKTPLRQSRRNLQRLSTSAVFLILALLFGVGKKKKALTSIVAFAK